MSPEFAQSDSANRRRSFRFSAEFKVEMASLGSARRFAESMCDFSPTGVRLRSTQAVPTGTHFELTVPDVAKGFFLGGEVVWCRPEQDGAYKVGIRFSQLDAPIGDRVCTRIREIETYRRTIQDIRHQPVTPHEAAREWTARFGSHC